MAHGIFGRKTLLAWVSQYMGFDYLHILMHLADDNAALRLCLAFASRHDLGHSGSLPIVRRGEPRCSLSEQQQQPLVSATTRAQYMPLTPQTFSSITHALCR